MTSTFRGALPSAVIGVAGTTLVAWASCHPEFAFGRDGWTEPVVNAIGNALPQPWDRIALVAGVALLVLAWLLLGRSLPGDSRRPPASPHRGAPPARRAAHDFGGDADGLRRVATVLALWSVPLLLVPPVLSADAVLYADLGWILHAGKDPYLSGLASAGGPFAPQVDPLWAGNGVAYPPLALLVDQLVVIGTGFHPYFSIVAMRLPAIAAVVLTCWLVPRLALLLGRQPVRALWWGVANPFVVLHFVGGAHNDALMVAVGLLGLWLAVEGRTGGWSLVVGPAVIGVAMMFKPQAGLAVLACAGVPVAARLAAVTLGRRLWLLGSRTAIATAVACAVFVGISLGSGLGFGWTRWLSLMGAANTAAPFSLLAQAGEKVIAGSGGDPSGWLAGVAVASSVTLLGTLFWVLLRFADRPLAAIAWGSLAISVLGQAMHPWYVPWSLALLSLLPLNWRQRGWVTALALVFVTWNAVQTAFWHGEP